MDELRVDTATMRDCAEALEVLCAELDACEDVADHAAGAVGERLLADALRDFADDWERSRRSIASELRALAGGARAVAAEFERVDAELGSSLRGSAPAAPGGSR